MNEKQSICAGETGFSGTDTPLERYELDVARGKVQPDPAQERVLEALQQLHRELSTLWRTRPGFSGAGLMNAVLGWFGAAGRERDIKGLYIWGGVGRGKTYLMDLFFHSLPSDRKMRMHFHRFMGMVHGALADPKRGENPLDQVAGDMAAETDVICFDEFFVSDIGDAMILGNLLEALFTRNVVLVATSNIEPDRLYENGLQRESFLPAIELIKENSRVAKMEGSVDYRLRSLEAAEIYHSPLGNEAEHLMRKYFLQLAGEEEVEEALELDIHGRPIQSRCCAEGVVWFEFAVICGGARSARDYIEIARLFHTVLISNIPVLDAAGDDRARRFITLVDEFYDHGVKLIVSAAAEPRELYRGSALAAPFERTVSRLQEMQSHEYLAREHKA